MDGGFWDCLFKTYREIGFTGFWKGYIPCALRAFSAKGCGFVVYEKSI